MYLIKHNFKRTLKYLLKLNLVSVNKRYGNFLPLYWSIIYNRYDIFVILCKYGSDLEIRDKVSGMTPLCFCVNNNHIDMVKYLLGVGVNIDNSCLNGMKAYDYALLNKNKEMIDLLLLWGCSSILHPLTKTFINSDIYNYVN